MQEYLQAPVVDVMYIRNSPRNKAVYSGKCSFCGKPLRVLREFQKRRVCENGRCPRLSQPQGFAERK
jgi:hypothetical protein